MVEVVRCTRRLAVFSPARVLRSILGAGQIGATTDRIYHLFPSQNVSSLDIPLGAYITLYLFRQPPTG